MFVDNTKIALHAGNGGDGIVAWHREKYIPKGGPAGGNGGNGASIILQADNQLLSLEHLRNRKVFKAENGKPGGPNNRSGRNGQDLIIKLPLGTLIKDAKTQEILVDLTHNNEQVVLCQGGIGGKGNTYFKSSTNQAPNKYTPGTRGQTKEIEFELKLIADIGLIGMPNAGKSTLISQITNIRVKIAPYPFTTLRPNLGIMEFDDFSRILIADIPGIIEKAHENKGLGFLFLRHIERTSVLLYVIDISTEDPIKEFSILQNELIAYNPEMKNKPFLVVLNKIDLEQEEAIKKFKKEYTYPLDTLFEVSALKKQGFPPLIRSMQKLAQVNGKRFF